MMRRRSLLIVAAAPLLAPRAFAAAGDPVVATRQGRVRGLREGGVEAFLGVPYGADTAQRRFLPAISPAPWRDVRAAVAFGDASPQRTPEGPASEDCLRLNIWTPRADPRAKRPVLVYIHGGEYSAGSGSHPLTHGGRLAARGDVLVVTLNHRLNIFGHLHLAPYEATYAGAGNAGLTDLVLALRWVRANIAGFGGDAGNITLFGQSGGGAKIACLMAMPEASGLFHRVMTMSGQQVTVQGPRAAAARTRKVFEALKLREGDIGGLVTAPVQRLVETLTTPDTGMAGSSLYFGPVLDEIVLPRHPFYPDAPPQSAHIPMIIGNTRDETRGLNGRNDPSLFALTWEELPMRLAPALFVDIDAGAVIAQFRTLYPTFSPSDIFFAATTSGRSWRAALIEAEARAAQGSPVLMYQLDWRSPLDGGKWGAPHTLDIPLVFDTVRTASSANYAGDGAEARRMAGIMSDMLLAYARTGVPRVAGVASWTPYTQPERTTMMFGVTPRLQNDPRGEERRFFAKVPYIQRGTY